MRANERKFGSVLLDDAVGSPMADDLTADEIRALLQLEPNATCGFVRQTYLSALSIAPNGLPAPFADGRPLGSALYFMVTPTAPVRLHRIRNDQLYHYYLGDPIELFCCTQTATPNASWSDRTCAPDSACSNSFPATRFIPRASSGGDAGLSAPAPNGRASSRPTSKSAISTRSPANIRRLPRSCAPSWRRCRLAYPAKGRRPPFAFRSVPNLKYVSERPRLITIEPLHRSATLARNHKFGCSAGIVKDL